MLESGQGDRLVPVNGTAGNKLDMIGGQAFVVVSYKATQTQAGKVRATFGVLVVYAWSNVSLLEKYYY